MDITDFCRGIDLPALLVNVETGDITSSNRKYHELFKHPNTETNISGVLSKPIWEKICAGEVCANSVSIKKVSEEITFDLRCTRMDDKHLFILFTPLFKQKSSFLILQEQEARMKAFFDSGSFIFWTVNKNIALTSFNQQYSDAIYELYGERPEVVKTDDEPKRTFASEAYHSFWQEKYNQVFETKKSVFFETTTQTIKGKTVFREIYLNPILDPFSGEVKEVAGMGLDVSKKKAIEEKAFNQSAKVETIFNATNQMIWSINREGKLTSFNDSFSVILNDRYGEKPQLGESFTAYLKRYNITSPKKWIAAMKSVLQGKKLNFDIVMSDSKGGRHIENISLAPIYDHKLKIVEVAGISQTVTFRKVAEQKLKEQAAKINAIFDSTAMFLWTLDRNYRITSYNDKFAHQYMELFGSEVSIGGNFMNTMKKFSKEKPYKNMVKIVQRVFKGQNQQFEGLLYDMKGNKRWLESFYNPIYSEDGAIKEIACLSFEITDKKIIESQMMESLREKEVLLQEVHHRVKNNLQIISSILNLQSTYVKDTASLSILRESQNRIKSMSFIHESLYHTKNFSKIEFSSYIESLTTNLIHTYRIDTTNIKIITDLNSLSLELDQAIPCGLIANELISNAIKYAFVNRDHGEIYLGVGQSENGRVSFTIGDNGIGLPEGFNYEDAQSLGLQLVYTLVDQLDAEISVDTRKGTKYLITFDKI
jgi:two-component sensor histidine kinase